MPASRPKRKRIRTVIIIILGRTLERLDIPEDGSIFEIVDNQLAKVLEMYNNTTEGAWGMNEIVVDEKFDALADYVEENETLDEETLEGLSGDLGTALEAI